MRVIASTGDLDRIEITDVPDPAPDGLGPCEVRVAMRAAVREVRALVGRRGVDVVFENVGVATWDRSLRLLAKGGRLVTCGATTGHDAVIDLRRLFSYQYTLMGVTLGNAAQYAAAVRALARGALRPLVDRVYPLEQARAALERLERAEQLGKIAVTVADRDGDARRAGLGSTPSEK